MIGKKLNHLRYIFKRLSVYKMNDQDTKVNQLTNTLNNLNLQDDKVVDLSYINQRINNEICNDTINKLKDVALISDYKECDSVQKEEKKWRERFISHGVDNAIIQPLLNASILDFIPPGTKGVVRGNKFNEIVKNTIKKLKLDEERFQICFEKICESCITTEIPDWYILEKTTSKVIIGMNQLDLWGGGQQINRGSKYLINNKHNTKKSKLLCVVCNKIKLKSNKNKAYKLFKIGYENDTLCYLKNLESIINKFFN